jgi:hypothetical protein
MYALIILLPCQSWLPGGNSGLWRLYIALIFHLFYSESTFYKLDLLGQGESLMLGQGHIRFNEVLGRGSRSFCGRGVRK